MPGLDLVVAVGLPLAMLIGGLAAWRMSKRSDVEEAERRTAWRDDSLDDWRKERDALVEQERIEREKSPPARDLSDGRADEQEQAKKQQRIGG